MDINLTTLIGQESELQFDNFNNEDALRLGLLIVKIAQDEIKRGIAIHIEYDEYPLFSHFMEGTDGNNIYWINAKKNVVKKFGNSSLYTGLKYKEEGTNFHVATDLPTSEFQAEGGSFPLIVHGRGRVGSVTVSGLTGEEDHALATEGIKRFLDKVNIV